MVGRLLQPRLPALIHTGMGDEMQENTASTEAFKARNGLNVRQAENGGVEVGKPGYLDYTTPAATFALEEFFQAKRDAELGRWRWPLNPDYVVYPDGTSRRVVRETDGASLSVSLHDRKVMTTYLDSYVGAARAYDEAHPERKPWEDTQYGEVWEVTHNGQVDLCRVNSRGRFEQVSGTESLVSMPVTHRSITAAERVWPKAEQTVASGVSSQAGLASIRGTL